MSLAKGISQGLTAAQKLLRQMDGGGIKNFGPTYTRPDAVEALRTGGVKTQIDQKPRTIQGPFPPKQYSSDGYNKGYKSKEEALMAGDSKYTKDGTAMQIRNYGASYAPQGNSISKGARKDSLKTTSMNRSADEITQTPAGRPGFNEGIPGDSKIEAHHRAGLKMYRPFFEGLEDSDTQKLIKYLESKGVFPGSQPGNRSDLPRPKHQRLHKFMREDSDIEYSATELAKKYNFKDMSLQQRLKFIDQFVEWMQAASDEEAYKLMKPSSKTRRGRRKRK
jgi:hypothetical protein